jgi:hypothetical protein
MVKKIECVDCQTGIVLDDLIDRLVVKDKIAYIPGLEGIMEQVIKMRLDSHAKIGDELLSRVKAKFEIPLSEEKDYRQALIDDHDRRITEFI